MNSRKIYVYQLITKVCIIIYQVLFLLYTCTSCLKHAASADHGEVSQAGGSIRCFLGKGELLLKVGPKDHMCDSGTHNSFPIAPHASNFSAKLHPCAPVCFKKILKCRPIRFVSCERVDHSFSCLE